MGQTAEVVDPGIPHLAILPCRKTALTMHCGRGVACVECRRRLALYFAGEMGMEQVQVLSLPVEWYRSQIGGDSCSEDQAEWIREFAAAACAFATDSQMRKDLEVDLAQWVVPADQWSMSGTVIVILAVAAPLMACAAVWVVQQAWGLLRK